MESKGSTTLPTVTPQVGRRFLFDGWLGVGIQTRNGRPLFRNHRFFWGFMTFLDIDSIHQVAKLLILAYFGPPFLVKVLQEDTSFISFIAKFAGRLEVSDMNQQKYTKIICIKHGCNPSKSQKGGNNCPEKHGASKICLFQVVGNKKWHTYFYQMVGFSCLFFPTKTRKKYVYLLVPLRTNLIDSIQSAGWGWSYNPLTMDYD